MAAEMQPLNSEVREIGSMKEGYDKVRGISYRSNAFAFNRETVVFIHGLGAACSIWSPFEPLLEQHFNILTYDLRGHGLSQKYVRYADYDLECLAADLHQLFELLNIRSCTLVSHSMGTLVALTFLRLYPGRVQRNIFISPAYRLHRVVGATTKRLVSTAAAFLDGRSWLPKRGRRMDYSKFTFSPDLSAGRMIPEIRYLSLRLYLFCLAHVYAFKADSRWSEITVPTTIMHGTDDTFAPYGLSLELFDEIPNARLVTVKGANHMLVINNRATVVEHLCNPSAPAA